MENYSNISGATTQLSDPQNIREVTDLLFDDDFFDLVVSQTNLYHHQMQQSYNDSRSPSTSSGTSKKAPNIDSPFRLSGQLKDHVLEKIFTGTKRNPTKACRVCSSKGKRSESRYICKTCCVPLHVGDCYTAYHTKTKY